MSSSALTPEQINLLRGLPERHEQSEPVAVLGPDWSRLARLKLVWLTSQVKGGTRIRLSENGQILLQCIDSERERVLEAIVGDLENAATDCDGHTPYSILMALAEEIRAEHSANPQTKETGQ